MAFSSVTVVLSSLLLKNYKKPIIQDKLKLSEDQSQEKVPLIEDVGTMIDPS